MHNNHHFLKLLCAKISTIYQGQKLTVCFSQEKDELIFGLSNHETTSYFKCIVTPEFSCLFFIEHYARARKNSVDLWQEIYSETVLNAEVFENERAFQIKLTNQYSIVFKFFGNRPNILLYKNEIQIAIFNNKLLTDRELKFINFNRPFDQNFKVFSSLNGDYKKMFVTLGKIVQQKIDIEIKNNEWNLQQQWDYINLQIKELDNPDIFIGFFGGLPCLSLIPLEDFIFKTKSPIKAINNFYIFYNQQFVFAKEKEILLKQLDKKIKRARNYIFETKQKLEILSTAISNDQNANILMANLHTIKEGQESVELFNFYTNETIIIKLKKELSPQKNAENYYRKSKNEKIEIETITNNITKHESIIEDTENKILDIKNIEKYGALKQFSKASEKENNAVQAPNKESLFKVFEYKTYEILVGKNSKNNDVLTLQFAKKNDFWFHARDCPGSHVVLKNDKPMPPPTHVIEYAAGLAATFSKRKNENLVPVIFTQKKYVRKTKGLKDGQVIIDKETTIMVEPIKLQ